MTLWERARHNDYVTNPQHVVEFAWTKISGQTHEVFLAIFLNTQNEILRHAVLNEGTVDQVAVYPRRVIEKGLEIKAKGIILVHNHPSGHITPSEEDRQLTRTVKHAAALLDMDLVDHIIVGKDGYFSFRENRMDLV